jgi:hypothetical protein
MTMLLLLLVLRVKRDGVNEILVSMRFIHGFEQCRLYCECGNVCQMIFLECYNGELAWYLYSQPRTPILPSRLPDDFLSE